MKKILGYDIFHKSKKELLQYINSAEKEKIHIISGNPEVLTNGLNDKELFNNFTSKSSIIIPDGVGVVIASKLKKAKVCEKIAGIEVFIDLLKEAELNNKKVYLLGATKEIIGDTAAALRERFLHIDIAGYRNGFFNLDNCDDIIKEINNSKANLLFVAMGSPRQEKFITKYFEKLNCNIFMGVGGSFDVIAGKVNRAPKWMIKLNLEWLYRVAKEPFRIKRLWVIPKFLIRVIREK